MEYLNIPPLWPVFLYTLGTTFLTSVSISLYLHRSLVHKSIEFSIPAQWAFRCWIWLATFISPEVWTEDHWHHEGHAPGHAVDPNDAPGYHAPHIFGNSLFLALDVWLFGWAIGCAVFALQTLWSLFVSGLIFGRWCHIGYRNFVTDDSSANVRWLSFPTCGESLRNNHHACRESARFSAGWNDPGWLMIGLLSQAGQVRDVRVTPTLSFAVPADRCTAPTIVAIDAHLPYFLKLLSQVFEKDYVISFERHFLSRDRLEGCDVVGDWFYWDKGWQSELDGRTEVEVFLGGSEPLVTYMKLRRRLVEICHGRFGAYADRANALEDLCEEVEAADASSAELRAFVGKLRNARLVDQD